MRKIFTLMLLLLGFTAFSQQYNNEWIRHSQTYYKFKVGREGLFRIAKPVLDAAGIGDVDVRFLELWRNGERVPIYTSTTSGPLATNGYIEFFGEKNDGKPDKALYRNPAYQHTTALSLISDSSTYFLSVNTDQSGFFYSDPGNDIASNSLPAEPYFIHKAATYYNSRINPGFASVLGEYVYSSSYDRGEFWSSAQIKPGAPLSTAHSALQVNMGGPTATLRYGAMGDALNARSLRVLVNNNLLQDTIMDYFTDIHASVAVPLSMISTGTATVRFENTSGVAADRLVISYFELSYPRLFNFGNQKNFRFSLPASGAKYLEITNFSHGGTPPVLLNLSSGQRITGNIATPGVVKFALGAGGARDFVLVSMEVSNVSSINAVSAKTFRSFLEPANQGDYLIISNKALYQGTNGANPISEYRDYRSSATGGGYDATIIEIDELVDQFGFGIHQNPMAIKNFLRYSRANFSVAPKFVLLIGRGVCYNDYRTREADAIAKQLNLVPTFGYPGSDNMLSSDGSADAIPITPIGRLSVVHPVEIEHYLEKVKEYENIQRSAAPTLASREWMKNVMHITGSSDPFLGTVLCNYMGVYKDIIQDTSYGGKVFTFCKGTTNSGEQVNSEKIAETIEGGVSMLTYFGHSSSTTLDFNIDNPESYENQGKYPVFFVNGCNAGNFFTYNTSRLIVNETLSEKFVLAKQRGSIAFVASTHYGIVNYLNVYLNHLYAAISGGLPARSLGELTKEGLAKMLASMPTDFNARLHAEEVTIHGDPAIRINEQEKPDYIVESSQVKINPSFISVAEEFFDVNVRLVNLGRSVPDSIYVSVVRQYPDGSVEQVANRKIPGIRNDYTLSLSLPVVSLRDKGLNRLTVIIDNENTVDEVSESNNSVTRDFHIFEDEARVAYPYNYSIVNTQGQKLIATTADPFSLQKNYVMELDTTHLFNSPVKVSKTATSKGGVIEFDPGISYTDSTVYYWRVSPVAADGYRWSSASFIYGGSMADGFNQSGFYQHTESHAQRITLDTATREWKFGLNTNHIFVKNGVFPTASSQSSDFVVSINNSADIASVCGVSGIIFNVFDPITLKPWVNALSGHPSQYGSDPVCGDTRKYNFQFNILDSVKRRKIVEFIDLIPAGHLVVVRNISGTDPTTNTYPATWMSDTVRLGTHNSVYHRLLEQGFTGVDSFNRPRAWVFVFKKDRQSLFPPRYTFSEGIHDRINFTGNSTSPDSLGFVTSPRFGPAKAWHNVIWRGESMEAGSPDNPTVDVIGINNTGVETNLFTLDKTQQTVDVSSVSAIEYPYLRLRLRNIDSVTLTPYQLKYWRINYEPVPEGSLAGNILFQTKDTLEVGEVLKFAIAFKNISKVAFDSIALKVHVLDRDNSTHVVAHPKLKPLATGDTAIVQFELDVQNYPGRNTIFVDVNPDFDQPEHFHYNNFLYRNFFVRTDEKNPVLDVTFDGVHILNNDIVSARPHIQIKLKDDAKFLLLNDTALSTVQVRYPDGQVRTFNYDGDTLRYQPASSGEDNTAIIDFQPSFAKQYTDTEDEYELIIKGRDRSGNKTGTQEYRSSFRVISKPMISNLLNYPNPFSTSTAFVFTLTGSEIPQNMKIQVLTVTGKIVREITKEELGPIRIGRNITEFKWDGTDQFGQKLANGVYLYRFVTSLNGMRMEKYKAKDDNTDKFFNNGYGKMYLMR